MDARMRQEFAECGYLVLPAALSPSELAALNATWDEHREELLRFGNDSRFDRDFAQVTDGHGNSYRGQRFWDDSFRSLIDRPSVLPILEEILGDPAWGHAAPATPHELRHRIRLDHDHLRHMPPCQPAQQAEVEGYDPRADAGDPRFDARFGAGSLHGAYDQVNPPDPLLSPTRC